MSPVELLNLKKRNYMDLVRAFIQVEFNVTLNHVTYNLDGSVEFSGSKEVDGAYKRVRYQIDKYQVDCLCDCDTVWEVHEVYKEMEF